MAGMALATSSSPPSSAVAAAAAAAVRCVLAAAAARRCFTGGTLAVLQQQQPAAAAAQQPQQQQQQQQTTGLAFEEIYIDSAAMASVHDEALAAMRGGGAAGGGSGGPITAVFLHGLLGSSRNWRSFTRRLALDAAAAARRDVRALLVDLRCHGLSAARRGLHPPHDMQAAAADVADVVRRELGGEAPQLLVGLSLGGKVALQLLKQMVEEQEEEDQQQQQQDQQQQQEGDGDARRAHQQRLRHRYERAPAIGPPEEHGGGGSGGSVPLRGLPRQVWVLDSQPGAVPLDVDAPTSVGRIIGALHEIATPLDSRQALYRQLQARGVPLPVAQWLGSSLVPGGRFGGGSDGGGGGANGSSDGGNGNGNGKLDWQFDIAGCGALYNSYRLTSYWDVMAAPPPGVTIHHVRGELSDRWTPHMLQQLDDAAAKAKAAAAAAAAAAATGRGGAGGAVSGGGGSGDSDGVGELRLHCLQAAGHWLHADQPDALKNMMVPFMARCGGGAVAAAAGC